MLSCSFTELLTRFPSSKSHTGNMRQVRQTKACQRPARYAERRRIWENLQSLLSCICCVYSFMLCCSSALFGIHPPSSACLTRAFSPAQPGCRTGTQLQNKRLQYYSDVSSYSDHSFIRLYRYSVMKDSIVSIHSDNISSWKQVHLTYHKI